MRVHEWQRCFAVLPTRYGKSAKSQNMCSAKSLCDTNGSIEVVVMPLDLVAIMESMVKQSCH